MTQTEINIAVAESINWQPPPEEMGNITHGGGRFMSSEEWREAHRPDYYGSLDAIVPVVRAMPALDIQSVIMELNQIINRNPPEGSHYWTRNPELATAPQWCEAYLRAKGLWK